MATKEIVTVQLRGLCKVYEKPMDGVLLDIWLNVMEEVGDESFVCAVKQYLLSDSAFFPKPGQIYQLTKGGVNPENQAALLVDKIMYQVSVNGGDSAYNAERAKKEIGEVGWNYIKKYQGGWARFSRSFDEHTSIENVKAQMRRSLVANCHNLENGQDHLSLSNESDKQKQIVDDTEPVAPPIKLSELLHSFKSKEATTMTEKEIQDRVELLRRQAKQLNTASD